MRDYRNFFLFLFVRNSKTRTDAQIKRLSHLLFQRHVPTSHLVTSEKTPIQGGTLILEAQLLDSFYVSSVVDDFGPPDWSFRAIRRTFFNELIQSRVPPRRQSLFSIRQLSRIPSRFCVSLPIRSNQPPLSSSRFLDSSTPPSLLHRNDDCFSRRD